MRRGRPESPSITTSSPSPLNTSTGTACSSPRAWTESKKKARPSSLPTTIAGTHFTPTPSGSRWYHSHAMSMADLRKGTYTGQFGFVYVEPASNPGNYDQELFLALRDWEPFFFSSPMWDMDDIADPNSPSATGKSPRFSPVPCPMASRSPPLPTPSTIKL